MGIDPMTKGWPLESLVSRGRNNLALEMPIWEGLDIYNPPPFLMSIKPYVSGVLARQNQLFQTSLDPCWAMLKCNFPQVGKQSLAAHLPFLFQPGMLTDGCQLHRTCFIQKAKQETPELDL